MSPVQRIANRFEIGNPERDLLGRGATAAVYRAADTRTGDLAAAKALDPHVVPRDPDLSLEVVPLMQQVCSAP